MVTSIVLKLVATLRHTLAGEDGQNLVEYALIVALIAFGTVASMKALSTEINVAFKTISSDLGTAL